jgi:ferredoxin
MSMDRRQFIKITGLSTLFGLAGKGAFEFLRPGLLDAAEHGHGAHAPEEPAEVAIHVEKCSEPGVVDKCIKACHSTHNIPDFGDSKNQVKWLWQDDYEHTFAGNENEYMDDHVKELPFLCLCNHCDEPPCVRVCPTKATFKRPDGVVAMDYHRCSAWLHVRMGLAVLTGWIPGRGSTRRNTIWSSLPETEAWWKNVTSVWKGLQRTRCPHVLTPPHRPWPLGTWQTLIPMCDRFCASVVP